MPRPMHSARLDPSTALNTSLVPSPAELEQEARKQYDAGAVDPAGPGGEIIAQLSTLHNMLDGLDAEISLLASDLGPILLAAPEPEENPRERATASAVGYELERANYRIATLARVLARMRECVCL